MPRQKSSTLTVQVKLRISEALRRRLEIAAKRRGVPVSSEMVRRLAHSFDAAAARTIDDIAGDLAAIHARFSEAHHEANKLGDLVRAVETMLHADSKSMPSARTQVEIVLKMIDAEAALAVRKAHTTGQ